MSGDAVLKYLKGSEYSSELLNFKDVWAVYPYFYLASAAHLKQLQQQNSAEYTPTLKKVALMAPDRQQLKKFLFEKTARLQSENTNPALVIDSASEGEEAPEQTLIPELQLTVNELQLFEEIQSYPELVTEYKESNKPQTIDEAPIEKQKRSFGAWLKAVNEKNIEQDAEKERDREELLRAFLKTNHQIKPESKASFYSPIEMARKSIEERDDIVSETLARIYAEQGDHARAIRIYQKLSLLNPEKSAYFAALSNKLTTK
ncbi:MAG: hypothetical protein ACK5CY_11805 [Bacteroidia bacterium]|jgi:hypothetical protein